ncbi:hypothetical protein KCP73_05945 [Salmonella enterica subsp. enterica]|nr:hypothetical protein KCP73_05945 [Salmonella enterica subsp. enterica]
MTSVTPANAPSHRKIRLMCEYFSAAWRGVKWGQGADDPVAASGFAGLCALCSLYRGDGDAAVLAVCRSGLVPPRRPSASAKENSSKPKSIPRTERCSGVLARRNDD